MCQQTALPWGRTQSYIHLCPTAQARDLADIDEEPDPVALVPVSTVIVIMVVLMVLMLPIPKTILVVVPLVSAPIVRPQLTDSSRCDSGKKKGHGQQHGAARSQDYIFHSAYDRWFDKPL